MIGRPYCCYCRRELSPPVPEKGTSFTYDHVMCQSEGGWKRVPCCRKCNGLKADLPPDDWFWFIRNFARWWKTFETAGQVRTVVREEHTRRAYIERDRRLALGLM